MGLRKCLHWLISGVISMRAAPGSIPKVMPSIEKATKNIVYLLDKPRERLLGKSVSELVNTFSDGTAKWLTGSTVWLPAVFDQVDENTDIDIVFASKDAAERFIVGALNNLPGYTRTTNTWGSGRILHPDGAHVIDAWSLEDDESIEELLLTYPNDYQRCAYFITWGGSSPAYLTRIIKKRTRIRQAQGGYRRARPAPAPRINMPPEVQTVGNIVVGTVTARPVPAPAPRFVTYPAQNVPITITVAREPEVQHVGMLGDTVITARLDQIRETARLDQIRAQTWTMDDFIHAGDDPEEP